LLLAAIPLITPPVHSLSTVTISDFDLNQIIRIFLYIRIHSHSSA
jgi:hypothetical protein